jgi:LytB protein
MRTTVRLARSAFRSSEVRAFPAAKLRRPWSALGTPWRPVDRAGAIAGSRTLLASRAAAISALPRPPDPEVDGARPCRRPTLSPQPDLASGKMHQGRLRDISYATTNRQEAVKTAARQVVAVIVVGAANSSNSQRLREVVEREGCSAQFIPAAKDIDWNSLEGAGRLARAPRRGAWRSATRLREAATERG